MSISLISLSLFSTGPGLAGILVYAMILFAIQENTLEKIKIMSDKFISIFSDETPTTQTQQAPMKKPDETTQVTEREVEQAQTQKTVSSTEKSVQQITPVDEDITETSAIEAYYNGEDDGATSLSALF